MGRFISKDPIGFAGGDVVLYGYVNGNPVNRIDPSGLIDPATVAIITWGLLYFTHAGDVISDENGNVWGDHRKQDGVCSLPWPAGFVANECVLDRCQRHDECYAENQCTASSWMSNMLGGTKPCNQCNNGFFK
jgi:hypothetical protein